MSSRAAVTAVIAAAGSGERLGAGGPKAFVPLAGRPMIEWSLAALRAADSVGPIVVACPPGAAHGLAGGAELRVVDGGATRAASVAGALAVVETELVAIHDAARPLVTADLVDAAVATLVADAGADGAIAAAPVTDTIKRVGPGEPPVVEATVERAGLWAAQTPQVFRVAALREALAAAGPSRRDAATDEAMLLEAAGRRVLICPASSGNFKVTTPLDLDLAELRCREAGGLV